MHRAYSQITIKDMDTATRRLTGIATTPSPDRLGDIVEPKGAQFNLPIPLLWQHDASQPIGNVTRASVGDDGIEIEAELARVDQPGTLKDRLDEAWQSIEAGLVRGLSIGFQALEAEQIEENSFALRFLKWAWLELSAVTIPANAEASISNIKAIEQRDALAALGILRDVDQSGVPDKTTEPTKGSRIVKLSNRERVRPHRPVLIVRT